MMAVERRRVFMIMVGLRGGFNESLQHRWPDGRCRVQGTWSWRGGPYAARRLVGEGSGGAAAPFATFPSGSKLSAAGGGFPCRQRLSLLVTCAPTATAPRCLRPWAARLARARRAARRSLPSLSPDPPCCPHAGRTSVLCPPQYGPLTVVIAAVRGPYCSWPLRSREPLRQPIEPAP